MLFWNFLRRRNYFSCKFWFSKMLIHMFFRFLFSKSPPLVMKYRMLICHDQWKNRNVNMSYFPYNLFLKFSRLLSINSMNLEFRKTLFFSRFLFSQILRLYFLQPLEKKGRNLKECNGATYTVSSVLYVLLCYVRDI